MIFLLKAGTHCWEADGNGTKFRNLFLIFKTLELGSGACDLNFAQSRRIYLTICIGSATSSTLFKKGQYDPHGISAHL